MDFLPKQLGQKEEGITTIKTYKKNPDGSPLFTHTHTHTFKWGSLVCKIRIFRETKGQ